MAWASAARAAASTTWRCAATTRSRRRSSTRIAPSSATRSCRTRSTTPITRRARRCGTGSRCRSCRPPTGAGRGCMRAAISKASCAPPPTSFQSVSFYVWGDGLPFFSEPVEKQTEITGPLAAKLFVSSSTPDADLFLVFRVFTLDLREVVFQGAIDPHTPIAQGWLRASHRKLDAELSTPYRPYHSHDGVKKLKPGEPVELDIELWPTSIVVPAGHPVALTLRGNG